MKVEPLQRRSSVIPQSWRKKAKRFAAHSSLAQAQALEKAFKVKTVRTRIIRGIISRLKECSLHGVNLVMATTVPFAKALWMLVILFSFVLMIALVYDTISTGAIELTDLKKADDDTVFQFIWPTITFCYPRYINKSDYNKSDKHPDEEYMNYLYTYKGKTTFKIEEMYMKLDYIEEFAFGHPDLLPHKTVQVELDYVYDVFLPESLLQACRMYELHKIKGNYDKVREFSFYAILDLESTNTMDLKILKSDRIFMYITGGEYYNLYKPFTVMPNHLYEIVLKETVSERKVCRRISNRFRLVQSDDTRNNSREFILSYATCIDEYRQNLTITNCKCKNPLLILLNYTNVNNSQYEICGKRNGTEDSDVNCMKLYANRTTDICNIYRSPCTNRTFEANTRQHLSEISNIQYLNMFRRKKLADKFPGYNAAKQNIFEFRFIVSAANATTYIITNRFDPFTLCIKITELCGACLSIGSAWICELMEMILFIIIAVYKNMLMDPLVYLFRKYQMGRKFD